MSVQFFQSLGQSRLIVSQLHKFYNSQAEKNMKMPYRTFVDEFNHLFIHKLGVIWDCCAGKWAFAENHGSFCRAEAEEISISTCPEDYKINQEDHDLWSAFLLA